MQSPHHEYVCIISSAVLSRESVACQIRLRVQSSTILCQSAPSFVVKHTAKASFSGCFFMKCVLSKRCGIREHEFTVSPISRRALDTSASTVCALVAEARGLICLLKDPVRSKRGSQFLSSEVSPQRPHNGCMNTDFGCVVSFRRSVRSCKFVLANLADIPKEASASTSPQRHDSYISFFVLLDIAGWLRCSRDSRGSFFFGC